MDIMENSSKNVKIGIILGTATLILVLLLIIKWQRDLIEKQEGIEKSLVEMKDLGNGIVRSQSQYVTKKDLEKITKSNIDLKPIENDLKKLNAEIKGLSIILASTPGYYGANIPSSYVTPRKDLPNQPYPDVKIDQDLYGYLNTAQGLRLNEPFNFQQQVPFGDVEFRAWEKNPWTLNVYPRNYSVVTVLGQDEEGQNYMYHKFSITSNNKTYDVKLNSAKFIQKYPESKFRFLPRLYLGVDAGVYVAPDLGPAISPNLGIAMFSIGKTKLHSDWTFATVGVGYEAYKDKFNVNLSPANYNLGNHLPLVDNLLVGPSVSLDFKKNFAVMLGVRVGL